MPAVNLTCFVDDDEIFVYAMRKLIQIKQLSEKVLVFSNVPEAIAYLKAHSLEAAAIPDILFLDINLPVSDGWDFMKDYQEIAPELTKKPRIHMLSSSVNTEDRDRANANPLISHYFIKPLSQEDFTLAFEAQEE